jgi:hypothetical protein
MPRTSRIALLLFMLPFVDGRAAAAEGDPFAGVVESTAAERGAQGFFQENFGFRKEIMSQVAASEHAPPSSRQSLGFEVLKKFSTETRTVASVNVQGRLVRRDRFTPVLNDTEGMRRPSWYGEYHNLYLDLYDPLGGVGRLNVRAGRFYVPFGLNLQTDTHGTILQLSNERNFGFERDWYSGVWGALSEDLNYDVNYLAGSGYDLKFKGQSGLGAARVSLANKYSSDYGLEGGLSALGGERLFDGAVVATRRAGLDGRYRHPVPTGLLTWSSELTGGRDAADSVFTQLYQAEYLRASRRWGVATQYRRFWREGGGSDASIIGEATWYFRNDVGNSNLHWLKLNVERQVARMQGLRDVIVALQYYRYW